MASPNSAITAAFLLLAASAAPAWASTQTYHFGAGKIVVTETLENQTPVLDVKISPSYSLKLTLDCRTDWDAIARAHSLDWRVYALISPDIDAFFARNRDRLGALQGDASCSPDNASAIGDAVRANSLKNMLTGISMSSEDDVIARVRSQWQAGKIVQKIPRNARAASSIRQHALIVTHTSYLFGGNSAIKPALDRLVREFKSSGRPVIYLMNDDHVGDAAWMTDERAPDLALDSRSGEHSLVIQTAEITSAGGYRELCEADTVTRATESFFKNGGTGTFTVNFPMGATYSEKMAYRFPAPNDGPLPALLGMDHNPSLQEAYSLLGEHDFIATLAPSVYLDSEKFHVSLYLDGRFVGETGSGPRSVDFKYWTSSGL